MFFKHKSFDYLTQTSVYKIDKWKQEAPTCLRSAKKVELEFEHNILTVISKREEVRLGSSILVVTFWKRLRGNLYLGCCLYRVGT